MARLGVLFLFALYAACATATDPEVGTTVGAPDAAADAKTKDTGAPSDDGATSTDDGAVSIDDGSSQDNDADPSDADADTDASDAGSDVVTPEAGDDAADAAATDANDGGTTDAADASDAGSSTDANDAASTSDASDASDPSDASDASQTPDAADASDANTSDASDASDATTPDAADAADAGCNDLAYGSPTLTIQRIASNSPAVSGGLIDDGTYNLTSYNNYTGTNGQWGPGTLTLRSVVRIQGNVVDMLTTDYTGVEKRQSGTFTTSGADITIQWTCPTPAVETGKYNAATGKFAYYPIWSPTIAYEAVHTK